MNYGFLLILCTIILLNGCSFGRSQQASAAKTQMLGMDKEAVLACMEPPKQRAHVGATEVWSYASTNGHSDSYSTRERSGASAFGYSTSDRTFCTVNVVMKAEHVTAIHYNGPRGGLLAPDEQCAYAVENCVSNN